MDFHSQTDVRACHDIREEPQRYIQSQYSASPTIAAILYQFRDAIKPDSDIRAFVKNYMSLETATGKGLDVLGRIIGITRTIQTADGEKTFTLADEKFRTLLKYKALANITDTSLATLNKMMGMIFPDLGLKVVQILHEAEKNGVKYNSYPMHLRWYTGATFTDEDIALFQTAGTLCLNAGVGFEVMAVSRDVFGFAGSDLQPFDNGVFYVDAVITGG